MYIAESKRLTHQGAKKIMTTAVDIAGQAGIAICAIVDAGGHMILLELRWQCTQSARTVRASKPLTNAIAKGAKTMT
jgi:uncharacterized protein GlcG (DUF336 family)